jgi:hypothetical protein
VSVNDNPIPRMGGNSDDDDDDPYGSNFNRRFYTNKGFRIGVIAVIAALVFLAYAGLAVVQELYIDNQAIGLIGGPVDQTIDLYWDMFNKPVASIFGVGVDSAT